MDEAAILRIVVLTGAGSRFVAPLLRSRHDVVGIVEVEDDGARQSGIKAKLKKWLDPLRSNRPAPSPRELAEENKISYFCMAHAGRQSLADWLKAKQPDLLAVYMGPLLDAAILAIPRYGAINIHPSLLPRYRGGHPILWMAYFRDLEGGVTVHFLDKGMDTGDIIFQTRFPITSGMSENAVEKIAVEQHGIPMLLVALDELAAGRCPRVAQPSASPTPVARRVRGNNYWKLIDWHHWTLEHTWHFLRCAPLWESRLPDGGSFGRAFRYRIGQYETVPSQAEAGTVQRDERGLYFAHPQGKIRIERKFLWKKLAGLVLEWLDSRWRGLAGARQRSPQG